MKSSPLLQDIIKVTQKSKQFEVDAFDSDSLLRGDPRYEIVSRHPECDPCEIKIGVNCLVPTQIIPKSNDAIVCGPVTFCEALNKVMRASPFDENFRNANSSRLTLSGKYVEQLCESVKINYVAAAVCFGLDVATVKRLNIDDYCRFVPAMFDVHYEIKFAERGFCGDGVIKHTMKCNKALDEYMSSASPRKREEIKTNIFHNLFGDQYFKGAKQGVVCPCELDIEDVLELLSDLNVTESVIVKILKIIDNSIDCVNLARRRNYRKLKECKDKNNSRDCCRIGRVSEDRLNLVCNSLTLNGIGKAYSAGDLILSFITSIIVACDICHIDEKYYGYFISSLWKKYNGCLVGLICE